MSLMRLDTALQVLVVTACVWLAVACVDGVPISELLDDGRSHEEIMALLGTYEAPEKLYMCYEPEETRHWRIIQWWEARIRAAQVVDEYKDLFERQPNWWSYGVTDRIWDPYRRRETGETGVAVWVTQKVPQSELPEADRIPECIGKVPVQVKEVPITVREEEKPLGREALGEPRNCKCYEPEETLVWNHPSRLAASRRAREVIEEHRDLFRRQPNWWSHGVTAIQDENGQETEQLGVVIWVSKKVDPSELPEADRIPDCIGDVPIEIREEKDEGELEKLAGRTSPRHRAVMAGLRDSHSSFGFRDRQGNTDGIARDNQSNERRSRSSCTP